MAAVVVTASTLAAGPSTCTSRPQTSTLSAPRTVAPPLGTSRVRGRLLRASRSI